MLIRYSSVIRYFQPERCPVFFVKGRTNLSIVANPCAAVAIAVFSLLVPIGANADQAARLGLMADLGVPDGMTAAVALRPHRMMQLHFGAGHNTIAPGLRAGVRVYPFTAAVSPSVAAEAGHYFVGNATDLANDTAERYGLDDADLQSLGYRYGNAHIGLRLGTSKAAFYLQGGVSWIRATAVVRETRALDMQTATNPLPLRPGSEPTVDVYVESAVRLFTPSARLGLVAYF